MLPEDKKVYHNQPNEGIMFIKQVVCVRSVDDANNLVEAKNKSVSFGLVGGGHILASSARGGSTRCLAVARMSLLQNTHAV